MITKTQANPRDKELARMDAIEKNKKLVDLYGAQDKIDPRAVDAVKRHVEGRKFQNIDPAFLVAKLKEEDARFKESEKATEGERTTEAKTVPPPKLDGIRGTGSIQGTDNREALEKMWDAFFSPGSRETASFTTLQDGIRVSTGYNGYLAWPEVKQMLGGVAVYSHAWNLMGDRSSEAYRTFNDDKRFTESSNLGQSLLGGQYRDHFTDSHFREAVTTSGVTEIVADRINKMALRAYKTEADPQGNTFPGDDAIISLHTPVTRWDTFRRIRWQELDLPPTVAEGAPYVEAANPADQEETGSITRYGYYVRITEQVISNDDQGIIRSLPERIGRALGRRRYRVIWDVLRTNATLTSDSVALANAAHANIVSSAFSYANVLTLMQQMRQQIAYSAGSTGDRALLAAVPKTLVLSDTLYNNALEVLTGVEKPDTTNRAMSAIINKGTMPIEIKSIPYWDAYSTTDRYWLLVDPINGAAPLLESLEYQGRKEPEMFVQDAAEVGQVFSNDLITYKGRLTLGVIAMDYRGFQGGIP